jgi:hypothetical protein
MPTIFEIDTELAKYAAEVRAGWAASGMHVGSDTARTVAKRIIEAHFKHGLTVGPLGFPDVALTRLVWVLESNQVADAHREAQRILKKSGTAGLKALIKTGKAERLALRALVRSVPGSLRALGESPESATTIETVLAQTASAGSDPTRLAKQLEALLGLFALPGVRAHVAAGVDARIEAASKAAASLHGVGARRPGTPDDTERLDVLDGMIIELVRQARAAARVASTLTGNQALAQAYAIDDLLS